VTPYRAPAWLPGGQLQTLWPALHARRVAGPRIAYRRERWDTPDGDFVDVDWLEPAAPPGAPLLVLFHGLEGSSRSHYAEAFAGWARSHGVGLAVPHFRGCSGEPNRAPRAYHSGDFAEVGWLLARFQGAQRARGGGPVLAVGGTRFAVYNRAGNELTVCSRTRTLYSQNFDSGILLCAMSNNNSLAVVTESGRYAAQVRIYDPSMRQTYSWEMTQSDGTPIAVDFAPDSRKFAAGMLAARDGQLSCSVYFMSTDADTEGPVYTAQQGSMLLRLDWQSESRVMAVFDTYIAVLDPRTGTETARYDFGGATLQSAAPGRRQTALLLNVRGGNSLVTLDENLAAMAEIPARQAFGVSATDTDIYLLCPNAVECFGYDGVQKWVQSGLDARPLAVLDAAQTLVFTGSRASVLEAPN